MLRRLSIALGALAGLTCTPALAAGDAAAGLQALKDYNLIVLGDFNIGHDVEGKALIQGTLSGNGQVGIGNSIQSQASSSAATLTVGGNILNANIKVNNGQNGASGPINTGSSAFVGGNVTNSALLMNGTPRTVHVGGNFSGGNPDIGAGDNFQIGGNVSGIVNQNGGTLKVGGSASGNFNGGTRTLNASVSDPGFAASISTPVIMTVSQVAQDVKALSTTLASLTLASNPSNVSLASGLLTLNAIDGGNGFSLFNFNASDFTGIAELSYNFPITTLPVIVNVYGSAVTLGFNSIGGANSAANQQVIWNFVDATTVNFTGNIFHGSVLAPYATVQNHTPIEGSLVAASFKQGGEVHLGTYNLDLPSTQAPPAVPEPASWAMMIAGLAVVGSTMRRKAATVRLA